MHLGIVTFVLLHPGACCMKLTKANNVCNLALSRARLHTLETIVYSSKSVAVSLFIATMTNDITGQDLQD